MDPGKRDRLIIFERSASTKNQYNEDVSGDPEEFARAWARVRFGTAQEKREAAQERAVQSATFECLRTPTLDGVMLTDTINFDGSSWDITELAPLDRMTIRFTGVRSR